MYVILVYDISSEENGAKTWRRVFKICKKYLTHIQNSVFEGELSESQIFKLRGELKKHLRIDMDSCIIFKSRSEKWLDKKFWGREDDATSNFL
ncbi:CRISPR-associated endonuclease Cas2 [Phosphitispora fastidiosa]|uniref:CRISPR-associated endonuclease Cas2 n=1 Tax=Phosphitispora fastidiosa TaxID=2837202 RepID=UPI001E63649B|nr:CRISPR-associated endonuclease Cas2 [Phosphitispora fastidiosa]